MTLTSPIDFPRGDHREPFFHHGHPGRSTSGNLQSVTRYLCAAAYIDEKFADRVVGELIENEHRAVAPSYGFDLDPVVRHCFRARRLWLAQNAALTVILIAGLCFATVPTLLLLALLLAIGIPLTLRHNSGMATWKLVGIGLVTLFVLMNVAGIFQFLQMLQGLSGTGLGGTDFGGSGLPSPATGPSLGGTLLQLLLLFVAMGGALTWARYTMLRTVVLDLKPGEPHRPPEVPPGRVERRLAYVASSQHGNVVMHAGPDPFLGAGEKLLKKWSITIELRPSGRPEDRSEPTRDPIDPVALNRHVKQRLAALCATFLPERQRVSGLKLRDFVVTRGDREHQYPLIDAHRVPFAYASQTAIEAIIRHPQASARHFLRATTGTEGKEVLADGTRILAEEDQEVEVSAFVHLAVEGGMLYVEYVATFLGALLPKFHEIDQLPVEPSELLGEATLEALRRLAVSTVWAPIGLVGGLVRMLTMNRRMNSAAKGHQKSARYNYGARISIRSLASWWGPDTYIRRLDAEKYSALVERRVNDAVLDYLESQQVDTSEYRMRFNAIFNNQTTITGGTFNAPVAAGAGATASG